MSNCTRYLGLDVHAETITAAIAEGRGKIRSLGKLPNRPEAVRKLIEKLGGGTPSHIPPAPRPYVRLANTINQPQNERKSMEKQLELIRHHTNHGGQPLGDLLWWELAGASVRRPDLVRLWAQGGLPSELLPEEPTAEKSFKTAARETQVGHPDRLLRLAMENELEVVYGIVSASLRARGEAR